MLLGVCRRKTRILLFKETHRDAGGLANDTMRELEEEDIYPHHDSRVNVSKARTISSALEHICDCDHCNNA